MTRFLSYVVEKKLSGPLTDITEYHIGTQAYDRDRAYDPSIDSVVRVEAVRLRRKLREYYANEGLNDEIEIALPTRGYVPRFSRRGAKSAAASK